MSELPQIDPELAAKIAAGAGRIECIEHAGRKIWVKRPEKLSGKLRLYKGDGDRAFLAEQAALHAMAGRDLPIAEVVAMGDGFIAIADAGRPIKELMRTQNPTEEMRINALVAGAKALAQLHLAGISHGRPNLKDMCLRDGEVRLIDFERAAPKRNTPRGHGEDVALLIFSAFAEIDTPGREIDAARDAYIAEGCGAFWELAVKRVTQLRWLYWVSRLGGPFLGGGRDFKAIKPTFDYFKSLKNSA